MGLQVGSGGQSGNYSGTNQGSTSGSTTSANTGTQTGSMVTNPTALYGSLSNLLGGNIGSTGLNQTQQDATDWLKNYLTTDNNNGLWQQLNENEKLQPFTSVAANTSAPTSVVAAPAASGLIDSYMNPYTSDVFNAGVNSLTQQGNQAAQEILAKYGGSGAFGGGGQATAQGTNAAQTALNIGNLGSNLALQGFNTAAQNAQQQAANELTASQANAANTLANNQFNANQQDVANQTRLGAIQGYIGNAGNIANQGTGLLQQLYNMGGGGINNIIAALGSQVPAFGSTTSGTTSGTGSESLTGTSSGSQSGYNSGSSQQGGFKI